MYQKHGMYDTKNGMMINVRWILKIWKFLKLLSTPIDKYIPNAINFKEFQNQLGVGWKSTS